MDLNLLVALDHLLREESVTAAAARMHLSAPAMSRTLGRVRELFGDPILVRAGRRLVPTPRAEALRARLGALIEAAEALVAGEDAAPVGPGLERTFTVRASDGAAGVIAAPLLKVLRETTPRVRLRFAPEGDEDAESLRDGRVDLDVGAPSSTRAVLGPELRSQVLFRDKFVAVVRRRHPLTRGKVTAARLTEHEHVAVSRRGRAAGPIDDALRELGLERRVAVVVPSFYAALAIAAGSELIAAVPGRLAAEAVVTGVMSFALPLWLPAGIVAQTWHPRFDADPAHRHLRACVKRVAAAAKA